MCSRDKVNVLALITTRLTRGASGGRDHKLSSRPRKTLFTKPPSLPPAHEATAPPSRPRKLSRGASGKRAPTSAGHAGPASAATHCCPGTVPVTTCPPARGREGWYLLYKPSAVHCPLPVWCHPPLPPPLPKPPTPSHYSWKSVKTVEKSLLASGQ